MPPERVRLGALRRSGMAAVCQITTGAAKYPSEIRIPDCHAGQTRDGLILCHQLRTIDLARVTALELAGRAQYFTDPAVRSAVRSALAHQLELDIPAAVDGV